jgi:hypothetical protein
MGMSAFPQANAVVGHGQAPLGAVDGVSDGYPTLAAAWESVFQRIDHKLRNDQTKTHHVAGQRGSRIRLHLQRDAPAVADHRLRKRGTKPGQMAAELDSPARFSDLEVLCTVATDKIR